MYNAYITYVKNIRPAENSDYLNACEVFGNTTIVDKTITEETLVLYLPSDGQISVEFGEKNNLFRRKDDAGNNVGGFIDPNKRNITAIRLRGNRSDGLVLPISCLNYCYTHGDASAELHAGDIINGTLNGHEICCKYIPRRSHRSGSMGGNKTRKKKKIDAEVVFPQHIDSPQLKYNLNSFKSGDLITITEKLEGTSHRSALLPVKKTNFFRRLFGISEKVVYKDYCGSRRMIINQNNSETGYYGDNNFRLDIHKRLLPHLTPNLEVFGEIVGWPGEGKAPLMGEVSTKCLNNKNFTKTYGEKMIFHYGCKNGEYDFYIYRICELDENGEVKIEYSTDQIISWCELHGFKYVPVLYRGFLKEAEDILYLGEKYCDGESTLAHHWREGCVIRRDNNARKFDVYKNKNFNYKMMKGIFVGQLSEEDVADNDILEEM